MKRTGRKRSTSAKRNSSKSKIRDDEETNLVKMLSQRAGSDRQIILTKEQYEEMRDAQLHLEDAKSRAKEAERELARIKYDYSELQEYKEKLEGELDSKEFQEFTFKSSPTNDENFDKDVVKLRDSLNEIEKIVSHRSAVSRKQLHKVNKVLVSHTKILLDEKLSHLGKKELIKGIKEISHCVNAVMDLLSESQESPKEDGKEETILKYRQALQNMYEQTKSLKDRLKDLEASGGLKKVIEDQEAKVQTLEQEKEVLLQHIASLQTSLSEQCSVIEHLKAVIASMSGSSPSRETRVPSVSYLESPQKTYQPDYEQEKQLQHEISSLDQEIQELQNSLQRALSR